MKVLLVNPPYQTLTSNLGVGHQVPLGLLMIGDALIDAGFETRLLDAEALHLSDRTVAHHVSAILGKLGVDSRSEAVAEAGRLRLLQDP